MKKTISILFLLLIFSVVEINAQSDKSYLAFSGAAFDVLQKDKTSLEGRIEYRLYKENWFVHPFTGIMSNIHSAFHLFVGFFKDIHLTESISLTPSFAPGLYYEGNSKRLGYSVQFRSQLELSITNDSGSKVGISFNHISNASLSKSNPGVESFALTYIVPFENIFGTKVSGNTICID